MPESADLLAAVAAAPADDLPRLIYADWLDDRGEPDYATFVRDQIRLAQVPSWDPLAVRARHQRKETLGIGRPFYGTLPELPLFLKWHPEKAFRRGFGTGVVVNQLSGLIEAGPQLFDLAPVDELWLGAASLDEWRTVARSPWLKNIRKVHLHFSQGLHEPIRCLAESPYSGNIDEIWFDTLATPAAGAVIEILAASPLAKQLTGLHMRLVHTPSLPEVIAALVGGKFEKLERFSMVQAGLDISTANELSNASLYRRINSIDLSDNTVEVDEYGAWQCRAFNRSDSISELTLCRSNIFPAYGNYGDDQWMNRIRNCILNEAQLSKFCRILLPELLKNYYQRLLCLNVRGINLHATFLKGILNMGVYQRLIEFNFADNFFTNQSCDLMLSIQVPNELVAFVVSRSRLSGNRITRLESHFGDRLVWAAEDAATGLAR